MMFTTVVMAAVSVVMMSVMVTAGIRIERKGSLGKSLRCFVSRPLNPGIKSDPGIRERHLRAHTDPAADQGVSLCRLQETRQRAVSASVGIYDLLICDLTVLNVIQLKLLRMAKMLKDLSVFKRNCDSHGASSFLNDFLPDLDRFALEMSARDEQPLSVYKGVSDFFSCAVINSSDCCPGDVHPGRALFLRKSFIIQKSQRFKLVNGHQNAFRGRCVIRLEASVDRQLLYSAASYWSWHKLSFLTYVKNSILRILTYVNKMKQEILFYKRAYEDSSQNALWHYMVEYFTKRYSELAKEKLSTDILDTQLAYSIRFYCMGAVDKQCYSFFFSSL